MTKIAIQDLIGPAFNWAVALCEGRLVGFSLDHYYSITLIGRQCFIRNDDGEEVLFEPSEDWSQGGPIIEREKLAFTPRPERRGGGVWASYPGQDGVWGETYLIAAMRCYVASKLGAEVDVPEEVL